MVNSGCRMKRSDILKHGFLSVQYREEKIWHDMWVPALLVVLGCEICNDMEIHSCASSASLLSEV